MQKLIRKAAILLVTLALLAYALKNVSYQDIADQFSQSNYSYILFYALSTLVFYSLRGKRWQQPLFALGYRPTTFRATVALMAGNVASMIFPGAGELARCSALQRTDGVPVSQGLGSVVAERLIDLIMLVFLIAFTLLLESHRLIDYFAKLDWMAPGALSGWQLMALAFTGGILLILALWLIRQPVVSEHRLYKKVAGVVGGIWRGFSVIGKLPNPSLFIIVTLGVQLFAWASTYLLLLSVHTDKPQTPVMALTILTVGSIGGLAVPTQAGIGTYHFLVGKVLMFYGYSATEGVAIATFMHAISFAINTLLSSLSFIVLPVLGTTATKPVLDKKTHQRIE